MVNIIKQNGSFQVQVNGSVLFSAETADIAQSYVAWMYAVTLKVIAAC